jgi:hypothetical protein
VKKVIGIAFFCILLLQVAGSYVYFMVRLAGIRQEMREQLKNKPDEELTLLKLTQEEYKISRVEDHEVKVNGRMYDIARITVKDNHVLVYALHDEAEDNLLAFLNEMVDRSSKDKKPVPPQLLNLLTLQFVIIETSTPSQTGIQIEHLTPYLTAVSAVDGGLEAPPPRS